MLHRPADILVLSPASLAPPIAHHLRLRRSAPSTSSSAHPAAKVELEEVPEDVARRGTVNVVRWAAEESFIKVRRVLMLLSDETDTKELTRLRLYRATSSCFLATCCSPLR